jgi:hypothetical protein
MSLTEETSIKINQLCGLKYPLNLVIPARRALNAKNNKDLQQMVKACSSEPIVNYL